MKRTLVAGLVALVAACASEEDRQLSYGPPQVPTVAEQGAGSTAQTTLQGSLTFAAPTQPATGIMNLADQLAASLGGDYVYVGVPAAQARKAAGRAVSQAFDTGGLDPACVTLTETSATWNHCVIAMTDYPYPGDSMTVTVDGTLGWNAATGTTSWDILETYAATMMFPDYGALTTNGFATLAGEVTVTDSTIVGHTGSSVGVTESMMGITASMGVDTTLDLDLEYQQDPFCVIGGTLRLAQVFTERPMGATPEMYPDQGWIFEWTGCNTFTVSHGS